MSGDRFVSVMNQFATVASYNFSEVEESTAEMKQKVCGKFASYTRKNILKHLYT